MNLCNATCALPFGLNNSMSQGSPDASYCTTCTAFVQRNTFTCVSSCSFVNQTTINLTSVVVCEVSGDQSYCPWYQTLNGTSYSCLSQCLVFTIGIQCFSSCPATNPLVSSAGSLLCINLCPTNIYFVNNSIN